MTGLTTFYIFVTPSWLRRYCVCKRTDKISVVFKIGGFQQIHIFPIVSSSVVAIYVSYIEWFFIVAYMKIFLNIRYTKNSRWLCSTHQLS
jgi:hypothetical protein